MRVLTVSKAFSWPAGGTGGCISVLPGEHYWHTNLSLVIFTTGHKRIKQKSNAKAREKERGLVRSVNEQETILIIINSLLSMLVQTRTSLQINCIAEK